MHTDDFDSLAVSAKTRPMNCNGFKCSVQVLTANILAVDNTRTDLTHKCIALLVVPLKIK